MEKDNFLQSFKVIVKQRNIAVTICILLILTNLLLTILILTSKKEVVIVPNILDQEMSITNGKMSNTYIEALTRDVINLMLDVSPSNVEYSSKAILKITHPIFYGKLKTALNSRAKDIINRKISTYFSGQSIVIDEDKSNVVVIGKLSTFLGKEEVLVEEKRYAISFKYEGYRPLIINFEEVNEKGNSINIEEDKNEKINN